MGSVALRQVKKSFGSADIIHGIDLAIEDGEFVALVGPSGCGKSTLLRIIAGLEEPSSGEIDIGGKVVNDLNPRDRNIAMVFQSYALYPHMSVADNMAFNLKLSGKSKAEIAERIAEAARMLDLESLLKRRPGQLSGGQRQRVAMGRAIVRNPAVFLFDEPLSNLDAKLRVQMRAEIKTLHQKVKTTAIYVTHDQIEAMTLADRIVVLNQGRIEQTGRPLELYRRPANLFVAAFIGSPSMNLLPATAVRSANGSGAVAKLADGTVVKLAADVVVTDGQQIVLGMRPENLIPAGEGPALSGPTQLVEPTGAQTHVVFDLAGQHVTAIVDGATEISLGDQFKATIDPELTHVFDKASGKRV
ncbi:MAG TPA: sn-glycerol-3-phosphate ABC transporter ATP-binding protein UgpC [Arsenicitalea sp.]|jgi:multiple sugar transport system ATP-binding protein|nr:sn-glycerol-3-phosphate ABC transporter ATP-binding protein UgpC [Arsenicitalea sp.]